MKIIIYSRNFYPVGGGVPLFTKICAEQLIKKGHDVEVITATAGSCDEYSYLVRELGLFNLMKRVMKSDITIGVEPSSKLTLFSPILRLIGKPIIMTYHNWPDRKNLPLFFAEVMSATFCKNVFCSVAIKQAWLANGQVCPNPYNAHIFDYEMGRRKSFSDRKVDFCYVGRLVPKKGVENLLQAISGLSQKGVKLKGHIIGEGVLTNKLKALCEQLGLNGQITFLGNQSQERVFEQLSDVKICVVPSEWEEPFGIVATEGLASGCRLVVSEGGGLKDAAGPVSDVFTNGSVGCLTKAIENSFQKGNITNDESEEIAKHLIRCEPSEFVEKFIRLAK